MALQIAAVANSIAGLSVTGVTLFDIDEVPMEGDVNKSYIIPAPDWLTDFSMERANFGGQLRDVRYVLTYRLLFAPVGTDITFAGVIDAMVDKAALFLNAIMAVSTLTGLEDIIPVSVTSFGVVSDPSDNLFWGCDIAVEILEHDDD